MTAQELQLVTAIASAIAAIAAAVATWRGPIAAARLAEKLRQDAERQSDSRRFRLNVFAAVMQERAALYTVDGTRALNSIDVAFADSSQVREAWAELYQALNTNPFPPPHVIEERTRKLLKEMSTNLGLADKLRLDDFGRTYYPNVLVKERQLQELQREAALKQLLGQAAAGSNASSATDQLGPWPPKPS